MTQDYKKIDAAEAAIRLHFKQMRHEVLSNLNKIESLDVGPDMAHLGPFLADIQQHIINKCIHQVKRRMPGEHIREESRYFEHIGKKIDH
tara:strand:- start:12466 stop:12735 length:270 start_codon:yes stop_codon:yes gene_type:complete